MTRRPWICVLTRGKLIALWPRDDLIPVSSFTVQSQTGDRYQRIWAQQEWVKWCWSSDCGHLLAEKSTAGKSLYWRRNVQQNLVLLCYLLMIFSFLSYFDCGSGCTYTFQQTWALSLPAHLCHVSDAFCTCEKKKWLKNCTKKRNSWCFFDEFCHFFYAISIHFNG